MAHQARSLGVTSDYLYDEDRFQNFDPVWLTSLELGSLSLTVVFFRLSTLRPVLIQRICKHWSNCSQEPTL
jgi:hypothetical protein